MATRVTQNSDAACAWGCAGAAVLEGIVADGLRPSEAVRRTVAELRLLTVGVRVVVGESARGIWPRLANLISIVWSSHPFPTLASSGDACHPCHQLAVPRWALGRGGERGLVAG